jgi:urate oxidase
MLGAHRYGKSDVRLVKVIRGPERHELRDLVVDVALEGDFEASYTEGDNTGLLATDTMRNTVYALARIHPLDALEPFARALVERFLEAGPTVSAARVQITEHPWSRLGAQAFQRGTGGLRIATVSGPDIRYEGGIEDLLVLRTTGSGWAGFHRDQYTTLPETDDRILATVVTARWEYGGEPAESAWAQVRDTILEAFADHYSPSVQFTLHRMGEAVLARVPTVQRIHFALPNRHHLLYDLARFGLDNPNEIFHSTTEPYGLIEGTVERHHDPRPDRVDR